MNIRKDGRPSIARELNRSQDLYKLYSLEKHYPGIDGDAKWTIATDLSREELEACDGFELNLFKPYIIITPEQGEVFAEYERLEKKLQMQDYRHTDMNAYEDGMEVNRKAMDYLRGVPKAIDPEEAINAYVLRVAINQLPDKLQRRLRMFFFHGFSEKEMAEYSKRFIYEIQGDELHIKNLELKKDFLYACSNIEERFKEQVDPSPKSHISTRVLLKIKRDFGTYYAVIDTKGYEIECHAKRLVDMYGKWGISTVPCYRRSMMTYEEFCGNSAFLDTCIKKLENFDQESCSVLNGKDFIGNAQTLQAKINNTAGVLDSMTVYQPNVVKTSVSLVALSAAGSFTKSTSNKQLSSYDVNPDIAKLYKELSDVSNRDMPLLQKFKDLFYDDAVAIKKVLELDSYIEKASKKYNVDKAMIQAVLYREIMCYGVDDPVADGLVRETYAYKHKKEEYDKWVSSLEPDEKWKMLLETPPIPPIKPKLDASTGDGQIFAQTAIQAYNLEYGTNYSIGNWKDLELFWNKLQDEQYNVEMVALVLKLKANNCGFDINNLSDEQRTLVFKGYNGSGDQAAAYGVTVQDYYNAFSEYNDQ